MNGLIHRLRETRLGDTVYRGLRTRISGPGWGGFHRDRVYQSLVLDLIQAFDFSSFTETGTDHGYSTELIASRFPKLPVFTAEVLESTYQRAKRSLDSYPNITMILGSSDEVVKKLLDEKRLGPRPLFYLDAHWHTYWPLRQELHWIGEAGLPSAIVIDDFEVPGQPQLGTTPTAAKRQRKRTDVTSNTSSPLSRRAATTALCSPATQPTMPTRPVPACSAGTSCYSRTCPSSTRLSWSDPWPGTTILGRASLGLQHESLASAISRAPEPQLPGRGR